MRDIQITGDAVLLSAATLILKNREDPSDEQISGAVAVALRLAKEVEKQNAAADTNLGWAQRDPFDDSEANGKEMPNKFPWL